MTRCTVNRLLGGSCHGEVFVVTVFYRELIATCEGHSGQFRPLLDELSRRREPNPPRCGHLHRTADARRVCERRFARRAEQGTG